MIEMKIIGKIQPLSSSEIAFSRVGIGFEKLDRDLFDPKNAYDRVAKLGVKKVRLQSGWMRTEKEKGVYDFAWLDDIIDNIRKRGMEPWLTLCYGNPLYTPLARDVFGAVGCPPIQTEEEREGWRNYVKATVRHYHGIVKIYEVWNEPNSRYSWKHHTALDEVMDYHQNYLEYGRFAIDTAKAIKEADPEAEVMAISTISPKEMKSLNTTLSTGLADYIDYASYHFYSVDLDRIDHVKNFTKLVHAYNPKVKIVQGESGCQSRPDGAGAVKGFAWTEERQMTHLLRLMVSDLYCNVEFASYFSSMDMVEALHGLNNDKESFKDFGYFGVIRAEFDENGRASGNYSEKPSYFALQTLAALFKGEFETDAFPIARKSLPSRLVDGNDTTDLRVTSLPFKLDDGSPALVYWNNVPVLTETYDGTISYQFFFMEGKKPVLVDLRNGDMLEIPASQIEDIQEGGILLKNLPIREFPMMVLFK